MIYNFKIIPLLLLIFFEFLLNSTIVFSNQGSLNWYTIETEHFLIHYYEGLDDGAQRVAKIAEKVHSHLVPYLGYDPIDKVDVLVTDKTDEANGSSRSVPYNLINVYLVPPDEVSTLENYDDWLYLLFLHEYTHLLHIDNAGGAPYYINKIFGKVYTPNQIQPLFIIEGMAVYQESRFNKRGRLNSSFYEMYIRMAVLENRFLKIDQIANGTRDWPHGNTPYLYGAFFIQYIAERYGENVLRNISKEYGKQFIPFAINRILKRETGKNYAQLYDDWLQYNQNKYNQLKLQLEKQGITVTKQLTEGGETACSPRFSSDGQKIYWIRNNGHNLTHLEEYSLNNNSTEKIVWVPGQPIISTIPSNKIIYFSRPENLKRYYTYYDIYKYDFETQSTTQITNGKRIRYFDISRSGEKIIYILPDQGRTHLIVSNNDFSSEQKIITTQIGEVTFSPRFSPQGDKVIFSWIRDGQKDLYVFDLNSNKLVRLTNDEAQDASPSFSSDGRYVYFSSNKTGIFNIYAIDLETNQLWQVTNVLGGAFEPDVSSSGDKIVFSGYSSIGFDIHLMNLNKNNWILKGNIVPHEMQYPINESENSIELERENYSAWPTFRPHFYFLEIYSGSYGNHLSIYSNSFDAAELHNFAGSVDIALERGDVGWNISYSYSGFTPDISIDHSRYISEQNYEANSTSISYPEDNITVGIGVSSSLPSQWQNHSIDFSCRFQYFRPLGGWEVEWDPFSIPPSFPDEGYLLKFDFGWGYSNARGTIFGISPEYGRRIGFRISLASPAWGSQYQQYIIKYRWTEYWKMPWGDHHVLAWNLTGALSWADYKHRSTFVLGGYPEQDILNSLLNLSPMGDSYLRGYPQRTLSGWQYHLLNIEYRFPIVEINRGINTLPIFLNRIYGSVFSDIGTAWQQDSDWDRIKVGVGADISVVLTIGYYIPITFVIGYARGLMEDGINSFYFFMGSSF